MKACYVGIRYNSSHLSSKTWKTRQGRESRTSAPARTSLLAANSALYSYQLASFLPFAHPFPHHANLPLIPSPIQLTPPPLLVQGRPRRLTCRTLPSMPYRLSLNVFAVGRDHVTTARADNLGTGVGAGFLVVAQNVAHGCGCGVVGLG